MGFSAPTRVATALICLLLCASCLGNSGPNALFSMSLNNGPYLAQHSAPLGSLLEIESGMNLAYRVRVIFPLAGIGNPPRPGLEIEFDPTSVQASEEITVDAKNNAGRVQVTYWPALGHNFAEGQMLVFGLGTEGVGRIVFEQIDAQYGGHVKGTLLEAVLYGAYESASDLAPATLISPQRLELHNFPFDVVLEEGWW